MLNVGKVRPVKVLVFVNADRFSKTNQDPYLTRNGCFIANSVDKHIKALHLTLDQVKKIKKLHFFPFIKDKMIKLIELNLIYLTYPVIFKGHF